MRALTDSSSRAFRELWKSDPLRAARWVSNAAAHAHVETPALGQLRELLALEGTAKFSVGQLRALVRQHVELSQPLGSLQASRSDSLGWNAAPHLDPPTFTGTVKVDGEQVQLDTPLGTFALATAQGQWSSRWAAEVGAFSGSVVTVRGWPDPKKNAIAVESFAPGSSSRFVQGRVTRTEDGAIAIQERPDKLVRITDPELAARLEKFLRVAFILPGEAIAKPKPAGGLDWHFDGAPQGYYMLTKLNPGDDHLYDADTPFEKTHVHSPDGTFSPDKLGGRVFVYGHVADEHPGVVTDRVRKFTATWVSQPILPGWQKAAEALGSEVAPKRDPEVAVGALDPQLQLANPLGDFEPPEDVVAQARRLARAWGVERKNEPRVRLHDDRPIELEEWEVGAKAASGPLDADGRKHGVWSEYVREPGTARQVALQGRYEHGVREGVWVQFKDGAPANAWQFEHGKLKSAGHVDAQLRPHGAWTLVGRDGLHDGGEGEYEHGVRVRDWWFYKPGTSDYERAEVYHPNGVLAAEGKTATVAVRDERVDVRIGEWRLYDEQGKLVRTVMHTADELIDGASGEQVGGTSP